jgi:hypothetical protein
MPPALAAIKRSRASRRADAVLVARWSISSEPRGQPRANSQRTRRCRSSSSSATEGRVGAGALVAVRKEP